jgi:DNA (cytosine-5)-methyltransferase 1
MSSPRLLDLFCGAGGAAMGYRRAGFDVVGVDIAAQPHYPFEFHSADALHVLIEMQTLGLFPDIDVIHASPPCQHYSALSNPTGNAAAWPDLIRPLRELLRSTGRPWVIENVARSPLQNYIELCGTMFGLRVLRHRWFEMSDPPLFVPPCAHEGSTIDGTYIGHAEGGHTRHGQQRPNWTMRERQDAIGIDWMTRHEMREAVPPAFTEWIGRQLLAAIERAA